LLSAEPSLAQAVKRKAAPTITTRFFISPPDLPGLIRRPVKGNPGDKIFFLTPERVTIFKFLYQSKHIESGE
jgi:hypothetical protein